MRLNVEKMPIALACRKVTIYLLWLLILFLKISHIDICKHSIGALFGHYRYEIVSILQLLSPIQNLIFVKYFIYNYYYSYEF